MPTGTTADYTVTRDRLIELAFQEIGVLELGQTLDGEMLQDGLDALGMVVSETDHAGRWRWTIQSATHLPLAANTAIYNSTNGLPTNITELLSVVYRNSSGVDSAPLHILKAESYEEIQRKIQTGNPQAVYLTDHATLSSKVLSVYPMMSAVATQSVVTGTDALTYRCIMPHTAAAVNRPITGANWTMFWELGGSGPAAWAADTSYTSPDLLRLLYRRPLYDFDTASDNPDAPRSWPRLFMLKVASVLSPWYGGSVEEQALLAQKAKGAFDDVFKHSVKAKSNTRHNKAKYY